MEEQSQRQGGFDREVRVLPLRAPRTRSVRFPGSDGRRGQPDGDVASTDQGAIIGGPVLDVVLRLVRGMDSRLHPSSLVCPLETSHRIHAPTPRGGWEVDVRVVLPDGSCRRERRRAPVSSRSAALRWGQARERELLIHRPAVSPTPRKEVPTLGEFVERFLDGHARANRQKPSTIVTKEVLLRAHLVPQLGSKRLDAITNEDVQRLKGALREKAPKTVNNILTVLSVLLKTALEWDVIGRMPCTIKLVKASKPTASFHDFDTYEQLVVGARATDPNSWLIVLLGGEAGLRSGEMIALKWADINLAKRQLCVQRSEWDGHVTSPKGGRLRHIPLTTRLARALRDHRHLRSPRVLTNKEGAGLTRKDVRACVRRAARRAQVQNDTVHILRHTFCSHLAMRGAPARAIQELAGHANLSTTQRYMHLSPAAIEGAIRLLDQSSPDHGRGDIVETADRRRQVQRLE